MQRYRITLVALALVTSACWGSSTTFRAPVDSGTEADGGGTTGPGDDEAGEDAGHPASDAAGAQDATSGQGDGATPPPADGGAGSSDGGPAGADAACTLSTHSTGLGPTWQDCEPPYTYDVGEATAACGAYVGDASKCAAKNCEGYGPDNVVCGPSGVPCWAYVEGAGAAIGHVATSLNSGGCPTTADPQWY